MDDVCGWHGNVGLQDGAVVLRGEAAGQFRSALEQMDLLLQTQQVDVALRHLVAMMMHLRVVASSVR